MRWPSGLLKGLAKVMFILVKTSLQIQKPHLADRGMWQLRLSMKMGVQEKILYKLTAVF